MQGQGAHPRPVPTTVCPGGPGAGLAWGLAWGGRGCCGPSLAWLGYPWAALVAGGVASVAVVLPVRLVISSLRCWLN